MIIWKNNCSLLNGHRQLLWDGIMAKGSSQIHIHQSPCPFPFFLCSWKDYWFGSHPFCPLGSHELDFILFSHFLLILLSSQWYIPIHWTIKFIPFSDPGIYQRSNYNISIKCPTFEWSCSVLLTVFKILIRMHWLYKSFVYYSFKKNYIWLDCCLL